MLDLIIISYKLTINMSLSKEYIQYPVKNTYNNFITVKAIISFHQKPILQLVDSCTYGTIAFPCIKISLLGLGWSHIFGMAACLFLYCSVLVSLTIVLPNRLTYISIQLETKQL